MILVRKLLFGLENLPVSQEAVSAPLEYLRSLHEALPVLVRAMYKTKIIVW